MLGWLQLGTQKNFVAVMTDLFAAYSESVCNNVFYSTVKENGLLYIQLGLGDWVYLPST